MPKSAKIPNVRFNLKDKEPVNKKTLIYALFRYSEGLLKYSTGEKVLSKYWDQKANKAKNVKNHPEYSEMNDRLDDLAKLIKQIYKDHDFGAISIKDLRHQLKLAEGKIKPEIVEDDRPPTFFEFCDKYMEQRKLNPNIVRGTWKNQLTVINHLKNFSKTLPKELDWDQINWTFRRDLENWMYNKKKHSINYASKMIKEFTQILYEAQLQDLFDAEAIIKKGKWHIKKKHTDRKFALSFEELDKFYAHDFDDDLKSERVRDSFMIGALSGLRFSDFNRIEPKHIIKEDGVEMIEISTQKTDTTVTIPLLPTLKEILTKYDYNPPKLSIQKFNEYIKDAAKDAGIDRIINYSTYNAAIKEDHSKPIHEIISSHNARRSFATNFYRLGIPAIALMQITGHTTERQFLGYICIGGRDNAKQVAKEVAMKMQQRTLKVVK